MRITFVLPRIHCNGGHRVIAGHARCLADRGHAVTVVSAPCRRHGLKTRVRQWFSGEGAARRNAETPFFDEIADRVALLTYDRPLAERDVPAGDVVIATWWETAVTVAGLGEDRGAKVYFIQGDERFATPYPEQVEQTWREPMHRIVVSKWLGARVRPFARCGRIELVANAVDEGFSRQARRLKPVDVSVGLVVSDLPIKGTDIAFEAIRRARARWPGLSVKAFGLPREVGWLDWPHGVDYVCRPDVAEMLRRYSGVQAWLFASRMEGFGLPMLEAMACGTPVIATPAGAAPELVGEAGGVLLEDDDPGRMAEAINWMAGTSEAQWQLMSEAAMRTARKHSWETAGDRFERVLIEAHEQSQQVRLAESRV